MAKKEPTPQPPRRRTPREAQRMIGRLIVPSMLLALLAISVQWIWLLIPAGILWVVMLAILFLYWRCPKCGKSLPKMGTIRECPRCGAKIE